MKKLEVAVVPMYFATMGLEHLHHRARAARIGPRPGDYERRDTRTSLAMGTASLLVPMVAPRLLAPITPGKGRHAKKLVAGALVAGVMTTIADAVARRAEDESAQIPDPDLEAPLADAPSPAAVLARQAGAAYADRPAPTGRDRLRQRARRARKVASLGGVATVATTGVAATTAWGHATRPSAMWRRRVLPDLGSGVIGWTVAMVGWDLIYYWNHRIWHEHRFMWANHVMHHSSERYNLSTALRQAVTDPFLLNVPYNTLSLLGIRPDMVATSRSLNLIYQYWIHTDAIDRIGPLEAVANTPSHHRVHHGVNPQYIDRNHGGILIAWDRIFGTFEPEDETVVYGLTTNINTFNPLRVATHEYKDMFRDVYRSTTWAERWSFVLRGPGWAYDRHRRDASAHAPEPQIS